MLKTKGPTIHLMKILKIGTKFGGNVNNPINKYLDSFRKLFTSIFSRVSDDAKIYGMYIDISHIFNDRDRDVSEYYIKIMVKKVMYFDIVPIELNRIIFS